MSDQDRILQFIGVNGPLLPTKVAKLVLKSEIIIASAHLSDLAAQGKVKISDLKVGGSPLYYLPGQEAQLEAFAQNNMNPKDYQVLMNLKDKKVLREKELDLLSKVALRGLKDFAFPLQVTYHGQAELFWKWHLLPDEESNVLIKELLFKSDKKEEPLEVPPEPLPKKEEISPEEKERKIHEIYEQTVAKTQEPVKPVIRSEGTVKEEFRREEQKKLEVVEEVKEKKVRKPRLEKGGDEKPKKKVLLNDEFLALLEDYFRGKKIIIEQKEVLRKNAEISFVLKVPSVVGNITYYCKAKNKAKCDEKDLSSAYMEAQIKKLPLLLLHTNEFTKKAQEMLDTGAFENAVVKKVE
ncbi:MAG: hypothetical protein WCV90_02940 [Candidatus Woesearchaeota archaeon]